MRNHVSGVLPNAFDNRIAASGLMPDLQFDHVVKRLSRNAKNPSRCGNGQP
jgi:hypothetical protein